jgi:hypothetical protein
VRFDARVLDTVSSRLQESEPTDSEGPSASALDDTPIPDKIWDGLVAWMRGTFAVIGTALAVSATLGYPRRSPDGLTGPQVAFLVAQAVGCGAFVVHSGRRLCRRYAGAFVVALTAGIPASLALLMVLAWFDRREPLTSWWSVLSGSLQFAALEAAPVGFLLWMLYEQTGWGRAEQVSGGDAKG